MDAHIHTYLPTYVHTYIHIYIYTYIHTYVHAYIHKHRHAYINTHTHSLTQMSGECSLHKACMHVGVSQELETSKATEPRSLLHLGQKIARACDAKLKPVDSRRRSPSDTKLECAVLHQVSVTLGHQDLLFCPGI